MPVRKVAVATAMGMLLRNAFGEISISPDGEMLNFLDAFWEIGTPDDSDAGPPRLLREPFLLTDLHSIYCR
jgi:hypothetical protein